MFKQIRRGLFLLTFLFIFNVSAISVFASSAGPRTTGEDEKLFTLPENGESDETESTDADGSSVDESLSTQEETAPGSFFGIRAFASRVAAARSGNTWQSGYENLVGYNFIIDSSAVTANVTVSTTGNLQVVNRTGDNRLKAADGKLYEWWVKCTGDVAASTKRSISGTITVRSNGCISDYAGNKYDLQMVISGITVETTDNGQTKMPVLLCWNTSGDDNHMRLCAYTNTNTTGSHSFGASYTVTYKVLAPGTNSTPAFANGTSVFMGFEDLDTPGFNGYSGSLNDYCEGVQLINGVLNDEVFIGYKELDSIWPGSDATVFTGMYGAHTEAQWRGAGIGYKADAKNGWSVKWAGYHAGTAISLTMPGLGTYKYITQIKYQQADGSWPATWAAYHSSINHYSGIMSSYSCTWSRPASAPSNVYERATYDGLTSTTPISQSGAFTSDQYHYIYVNRLSYTYSFDFNPPSGYTDADITNKQAAFTKYAESLSEASLLTPALTGYVFKGWNTKADGTGTDYVPNEAMLSNKLFYAQWEPLKYQIHYDGNGAYNPNHMDGEFTQNTVSGTMENSEYEYDVTGSLRANAFVRDGYEFLGWNTKADGTGTAYPNSPYDKTDYPNSPEDTTVSRDYYSDGYNRVYNMTTEPDAVLTLYAQWRKKLGTETITVVSEETGNPVSGVTFYLHRKVNGTWVQADTKTTGSDGKITVNNLHWFDYEWAMSGVPAGYKVSSENTAFSINYDRLSAVNDVILYMKHVQVVLNSVVSDIIEGEAAPAFMYEISGTDVAGVAHSYHVLVQTDYASKQGTNKVPDLFAGTYTVTQQPVSRYNAGNAQNISHATPSGINATVDVKNYDLAEVKFPYTIQEYGWLSHVDSTTNVLHK